MFEKRDTSREELETPFFYPSMYAGEPGLQRTGAIPVAEHQIVYTAILAMEGHVPRKQFITEINQMIEAGEWPEKWGKPPEIL